MTKHKLFSWVFIIFAAIFALLNLAVYYFCTADLLLPNPKKPIGDLSRIGYVTDIPYLQTVSQGLSKKHWNLSDFPGGAVDIITIGDSFSNAGVGAWIPYQDYIASLNDLKVLNIDPYQFVPNSENYLAFANNLLDSGWLDKYRPRVILIQKTERVCLLFFSEKIDFDRPEPVKLREPQGGQSLAGPPQPSFINNANLKYFLYPLLYYVSDNAFFSEVYVTKLNKSFFSGEKGDKLVFLSHDLTSIRPSKRRSVKMMNDNLNALAEKLEKHNIKLYFMPVVDKYNLYRDYIVNNPYPPSVFFEELRELPKKYYFIDTKKILSQELQRGVIDLYHQGDTHWTYKATKAISEKLKF
jgi:hypothetical protein